MGRPSSYTPELAAKICERLAAGESLNAICKDEDMPDRVTVYRWVDANEEFRNKYACARDMGLDVMADDVIAIADTPVEGTKTATKEWGTETTKADMIDHRKLRVDTRKWYLSKLAPKRYGDKQAVEVTGADGGPIAHVDETSKAARLAALLATAAARKDQPGSDLV